MEPASAASVAGLLATAADGRLPAGSLVVCTVTGNGLKDPGHGHDVHDRAGGAAGGGRGRHRCARSDRMTDRPGAGRGRTASTVRRSPCGCRRPRPISAPVSTASGWPSPATTRSAVSRTDGGLLVEVAGVGAGEVPLTARASRGPGDRPGVRRAPASHCPACTCGASTASRTAVGWVRPPRRSSPGCCWAGNCSSAGGGPQAVRRRSCWAWRTRWRAIPTTLPPPCSAASPWPTWTTTVDRWRSGARCIPTSGWWCSARTRPARPITPAGCCRRPCRTPTPARTRRPPGCWCTR